MYYHVIYYVMLCFPPWEGVLEQSTPPFDVVTIIHVLILVFVISNVDDVLILLVA